MNFECAAQIHVFEPVLFLLKALLERIFLRLYARNLKLGAFQIKLHLNKFSQTPDLVFHFELPLPQSEVKGVLQILSERLQKNLQQSPLKEALEGISMEVTHTVPSRGSQRNFFSKREEEIQALASLLASLEERLGAGKSFQARPSPRLLPEASWARVQAVNFRHTVENTLAADKPHLGAKWDSENFQKAPLRPLHLLNPPIRIQRMGAELFWPKQKSWRVKSFLGPERLEGEWWLGGFLREYFRVETDNGETLWIFKTKKDQKEHAASELWLHGFYD